MVEKKIEVRGKSQWRKMKTSCAIVYIYILILEAPAGARRLPPSEQVFYAVDVEGEREAEGLVKRIA